MTVTIHQSLLNNDLVIITIIGKVSFEKGLSASKHFYSKKLTKHVMWDMRQANAQLVSSDNIETIMNFTRSNAYKRPIGAKTALVVSRPLEFGISRMVQTYAEMHKIKIQFEIFYDYQLAMKWFIEPKNRINLNSSDLPE